MGGNAGSHMYAHGESAIGQQNSGGYSMNTRSVNQSNQSVEQPKPPAKPCSFDALRALMGGECSDDDSDREGGASDHHPSDQDSTSASGAPVVASSDDDRESKVGKEVTQEERAEAERVVSQAFQDVKERDRMRTKVSTASAADLQAMMNARLKKPPEKR